MTNLTSHGGGAPGALVLLLAVILAAGCGVAGYLLGKDRSFLFTVSTDSLEVHPLPPRADLESRVRGLTQRVQTFHGDPTAERRLARQLGRTLLGPAAPRIVLWPMSVNL